MGLYFAKQCITLFSKCAIVLLITNIAFLINNSIVSRLSFNQVVGISTTPILKWLDHRFMKMLTRTYFDTYQLNHIKLDKTVNVVLQNNFSLSSWVKNKRYLNHGRSIEIGGCKYLFKTLWVDVKWELRVWRNVSFYQKF